METVPLWMPIVVSVLFLLVYISLVLTETASDAMDDSDLRKKAEEGDKALAQLFALLERPSGLISAVQGARHAVACCLGASVSAVLLPVLLAIWPFWGALAADAVLLIAIAAVPGGLLPRALGMRFPETVLKISMPLSCAAASLLLPAVRLHRALNGWLLQCFGSKDGSGERFVSEEEIMQMVDIGEEKGAIESDEREMIENVLEFNNIDAGDCMTHRTDIAGIPEDAERREILSLISESGYTRFPVYREDIDTVLGVFNARDYLLAVAEGRDCAVRDLMRPAYFVPESVRADQLFTEMQRRKQHLAIVVDEYGGTAGVVTLEDLLEQIVGDIYDEFDAQEPAEIVKLGEDRFHVAGTADLSSMEETMGVEIALEEDEEVDTLGGLVFSHLPEIPMDGEKPHITVCGLDIEVESIRDHRLEWAIVTVIRTPEEDTSQAE